jgi:hypothetical protein
MKFRKMQSANMSFSDAIKKDCRMNWQVFKDDYDRARQPDFFPFYGTQVFCGLQGSGKTISMVKTLLDLKRRFPAVKVVTNLKLNVSFDYELFSSSEELADLLTRCNNGQKGVIYAIDEIHTYFNSLDSKSIPMYVFTEISQQRKQRKLIIGTSQLFLRMAKPLREQCDTLIMCECFLGKFNRMTVFKGATLNEEFGKVYGDVIKIGWFMQTRKLRDSFDTFQKIVSSQVEYDQSVVLQSPSVRKKGR